MLCQQNHFHKKLLLFIGTFSIPLLSNNVNLHNLPAPSLIIKNFIQNNNTLFQGDK